MLRLLLVLLVFIISPNLCLAAPEVGKPYVSGHEPSASSPKSGSIKAPIIKKSSVKKVSSKSTAARRAQLTSRNTDIKLQTAKAPKRFKTSKRNVKKQIEVASKPVAMDKKVDLVSKRGDLVNTNPIEKSKAIAPKGTTEVAALNALSEEIAQVEKEQARLASLDQESGANLPAKVVAPKVKVASDYEELEGLNSLEAVGPFTNFNQANYYEIKADGSKSVLTLDRDMQAFAEELLEQNRVAWGAVVAINPKTGAVKSLAGYSDVESNGQAVATRNSFPAASLFKIITAAAAVETSGYSGGTEVAFRGGTYTLGKQNYLPNKKTDKQKMSLGLALGKSCNPVFARVALNDLSTDVIKRYASNFGFNKNLAKDFSLKPSTLDIDSDSYSLARTAAGFGSAFISPVHASVIAGAVGNNGIMMRPFITDHINDKNGKVLSKTQPEVMGRSVSPSTATELLDMMSVTVSQGTARKHFKNVSTDLRSISVAAKTGTLSGKNPKGLYHWFVAVAPVENPKIAIATLVIDNGRSRINGVGLGKKYLERYFANEHSSEQASSLPVEKLKGQEPLG